MEKKGVNEGGNMDYILRIENEELITSSSFCIPIFHRKFNIISILTEQRR